MNWCWKVARLAGIGIYIHWTLVVVFAWIGVYLLARGESQLDVLRSLLLVAALFVSLVLHEMGHALAARRFGIGTREITIYPIGGMARLERMPEEPRQELLVALAGPAISLLLAGSLYAVAWACQIPVTFDFSSGDFLLPLFWMNLLLAGFNLLPAFPMDGGRALRAILAWRMDYLRATRLATSLGQGMALVFGFVGLLQWNPLPIFAALVIFLIAQDEARQVHLRMLLAGTMVRDAMLTRFNKLRLEDTLEQALLELLDGSHHDFPVVDGEHLVGVLPRSVLFSALEETGGEETIGHLTRRCSAVEETDSLISVFQRMRDGHWHSLPVTCNGLLTGVITLENIGQLMLANSAQRELAKAGSS